jgi:hypothetical protein
MLTKEQIVNQIAQQLQSKDLSRQIVDVLQRSTDRVLERVKQNVDAQIKEDSSPIVANFSQKVSDRLVAQSQSWADNQSDDLVLFPEGTRHIYRDADVTTIMVEQPPVVRSIAIKEIAYNTNFFLSLPYVQFIIPFKNGQPLGIVLVGCSKKSVSNLDQPIYHLPLPNINSDHKVCMGGSFNFSNGETLTDKTNNIISSFWQSVFTQDYADFYYKFLDENFPSKMVQDWERESRVSPLFAVGKYVKYDRSSTYRKLVVQQYDSNNSSNVFMNNMKQEIVNSLSSISVEIQNLLTTLDLKTENREKVHVENLQDVFKEIIVIAYSELWGYLQSQLEVEKEKINKQFQEAAKKLAKDFTKFAEIEGAK